MGLCTRCFRMLYPALKLAPCNSMKQFVHNTQHRSISAYYLSGTASESVLNQAVVPIVAQSVCKKPDWYGDRVFDVQFCAGYEQGIVDSCTVRRLPNEHHRLPTITYMLYLNLNSILNSMNIG